MSKARKKRSASPSSPSTTSLLSVIEITSLSDCYYWVSPNEYSDKTFGVLAFLLRKSVGDINFSDIFDDAEERDRQGRAVDFSALLEAKRDSLKEIDASIEKCLMINRFISDIKEDEKRFMTIRSHIQFEMKVQMTDNQLNQLVQYPNDFRQREVDFFKRKIAQDVRRLFYRSHKEAKEPPSIIHLKNRTTLHLTYLIDYKMRFEPKFRDTGLNEIFNILSSSFMIIAQPHVGVNPVIIYEREKPGIYKAKVSVIIVSLLHDFMRTHPNMIELYDIEPTLCPLSPDYKLEEPRSIPWTTYHLQACLGDKPQIVQYAELTSITIHQTCKKDTRVHFAQALHTLKFTIKFRINLTEYRFSRTHQITLESLPFAIGQHNNQIPQLLTRVMLDDIRRFGKPQSTDVKTILYFILRYFMHRTGVEPHEDQKIYLEEELNIAMNARKNFQSLEDIYMDFLVPYVYQVEFMAKHPILAMFYADGLFLGPCNSERAGEILKRSSNGHSPKVGLRLNSIKVDYAAIASMPTSGRPIKLNACAVRVDIYNNPARGIQNHTFDSSILPNDISNFVSTASLKSAGHIRILSKLDQNPNANVYKFYPEFNKYYHDRLHEISKTDQKYKLITDIFDNIDYDNDKQFSNIDSDNLCLFTSHTINKCVTTNLPILPHSTASIPLTTVNNEQNVNTTNVHDYRPIPYGNQDTNQVSSQNVLLLSNQQLIQYIFSQPDLLAGLIHQMNILNLTAPTEQPQALYQQQIQYSYQQQISPHIDLNQSEFCVIENSSQQSSTQVEILETSADASTVDLLESITIDQLPLTLTDEDYQMYLDELTTDNLPSPTDQ